MEYDIFISYSRIDTQIADKICSVLDLYNISYFIDRKGISGGLEFPEILADAIDNCKAVLFIGSKNSYESRFTTREITYAFNEKKEIIPYKIDNFPMPKGLKLVFSGINWRTITEHPIESVLIYDILNIIGKNPNIQIHRKYKIGDFFNESGKQGIVFQVDDNGTHGKILSLYQSNKSLPWCIKEEYDKHINTGATNKTDGLSNFRAITKINNWEENYPAFYWCKKFGEGWYLPAIQELETFLLDETTYSIINQSLQIHNGNKLFDRGDVKFYWSSTEKSDQRAWYVRMFSGTSFFDYKYYRIYHVRPIAIF